MLVPKVGVFLWELGLAASESPVRFNLVLSVHSLCPPLSLFPYPTACVARPHRLPAPHKEEHIWSRFVPCCHPAAEHVGLDGPRVPGDAAVSSSSGFGPRPLKCSFTRL